jgi:hypothetical protein
VTQDEHIAAKHVRVIGEDKMCFWADPLTLEPLNVGSFDPWCFSDPLPCASMSASEWSSVRYEQRSKTMNEH